jgi:hypothetical protein
LAVEALLEVVESGRSLEICVVRSTGITSLADDAVAALIADVEKARAEAEAAAKKAKAETVETKK